MAVDRFNTRAWDKRDKSMIEISDMYWFEEHYVHDLCESDEYIFMQSTGVPDIHGQGVYEADIVLSLGARYVIMWDDRTAAFGIKPLPYDIICAPIRRGDTEVIGNIHENPELLNY